MSKTIYVPPGEEGDEAVMRIIPKLHAMTKAEQNARRSDQ